MSQTETHIIILGGTGDLSRRKLLPALFDLYRRQALPDNFSIFSFAHSERTDEEYRAFVREALSTQGYANQAADFIPFCERIFYSTGDFCDNTSYQRLEKKLVTQQQGSSVNRLFYLAVPPAYYEDIFQNLHDTNLALDDEAAGCWNRILVEKPFGKDLTSAQALEQKLSELFTEHQIYRIDHYLAKEAVQNILSFRFANTLIQQAWDKSAIESVRITMHETIDVAHRGNFYDGIGALRDVGQNHLLQLLALIAMREPTSFTPDAIRVERERVLRSLKGSDLSHLANYVVRGQYEGYQDIEGVSDNSQTETYFALKAYLDREEWDGVPFFIEAGKALAEACVQVTITFFDIASGPFETETCRTTRNQLVLTISPEQTMSITLNAKAPGLGFQIESRSLAFTCQQGDAEIKNSYEKVLLDCISGDQTLFTSSNEVVASWAYVTPILEHWHSLPLHTYKVGSRGPEHDLLS